MLLEEAFDYWVRVGKRRESTRKRYLAALRRISRWGITRVEDVTRDRVIELQASLLSRGLKVPSIRTDVSALRSVAAQLEAHGRFPTGTLAEVRKVALDPPEVGTLRRARHCDRIEFEALASSAARVAPRIEMPIRVAAWSGPRPGELARMRGEDRQGRFFVIETLPEYGEAGSCKTGPRLVPICDELEELLDRLPRKGWIFPSGTLGGRPSKTPFLSRWTLEEGIKLARREAGLPEDLTFMVLRHTRASWWLQGSAPEGGASIYKVADWLGHSVQTCEKHYGGLKDGYDPECERAPAA